MMKRIVISMLLILLLGSTSYAQKSVIDKPSPKKTYWLKYSLIFLHGCTPRVFPNNIIFTEGECSVDAYGGKILSRGTKVELNLVDREKGFAKVSFKQSSSGYEILMKNDSERSFRKSFNLLFTEKELTEWYDMDCPNNIKTKNDVIRCLGFPISITKDGDVEQYFYILEFVGPNPFSGYDGFNIKMKKSKVIDVSGYI